MAERVGFEPTVRLRAHLISSQARSTTPAPLRGGGSYRLPGTGETAPGPGTSLNSRSFSIFGTRAMPLSPEELTDRIHRATPFVATLGARVVEAGGKSRAPYARQRAAHAGSWSSARRCGGRPGGHCLQPCASPGQRDHRIQGELPPRGASPAPAGRGEAAAGGRTTAVTQAEIWAEQDGLEDRLVAIATATLQPIARES